MNVHVAEINTNMHALASKQSKLSSSKDSKMEVGSEIEAPIYGMLLGVCMFKLHGLITLLNIMIKLLKLKAYYLLNNICKAFKGSIHSKITLLKNIFSHQLCWFNIYEYTW